LDDVQGFLLRYRVQFEKIVRWQDEIVRRSMAAFDTMLPRMPFEVKTDMRNRWEEGVMRSPSPRFKLQMFKLL